MNDRQSPKKNPLNKGFALYYSVLFSGMLLVVGLTILNWTLKEFLLSSSLKNSAIAFYAADSGIDCALYWDLTRKDSFPTTSPANAQFTGASSPFNLVTCGGGYSLTRTIGTTPCPSLQANPPYVTVRYNMNNSYGVCVQISKSVDVATGVISTKIESTGQNVLQNVTTGNLVSRSIRTSY